jgi:DNA helicase-2/ATP-dependent DNA helicase PcrA
LRWSLDDTLAVLAEGRPGWDLTAEQRAAVGAPLEPGLIIAGAGSGKTEVMAARVVHLVASGQVRPGEVLGLTFTTKATASLATRVRAGLERLRALVPGGAAGAAGSDLDGEPTISTYNGYGARLVSDYGLRIGIEPATRLAPEGLRWQLALAVVRRWEQPLDVDLTPASVAERVRQLADELASHLATPADVHRATERLRAMLQDAPTLGAEAKKVLPVAATRLQLVDLVAEFDRAKRDALLLDYGDQIALAAQLALQAAVVVAERTAHRVVLLDEYQDTGVGQRILLQRLYGDGHPVTAVGDPAQSIYGFRGASVGNILNFPQHFPAGGRGAASRPAQTYPLAVNFRSGGAVLDVANRIVEGLSAVSSGMRHGTVAPPVLRPREGRHTGGPDGGDVRVRLLADAECEAQWVADEIGAAVRARRETHRERCREPACEGWHEAAVLCRRRSQFGLLRQALERAEVPVEVIGLGGLLDAPEVSDLVAVLRVLHEATANAAMVRLLTGPRWRIGLRDLDALGRRAAHLVRGSEPPGADETGGHDPAAGTAEQPLQLGGDEAEVGALADVLEQLDDPELRRLAPLSEEAERRLHRLHRELAVLRRRVDQPLPDLIADIERTTGLDVELEATPERVRRGRRANVLAFLDVAADFVGLEGQTDLGAFLASLDAAEKAEDGYDLGTPSAADAVKLMTIHAAKGLEWDVVCVPGLSKNAFPNTRGSRPWPWRAEALPGELRGDRADLPVWTDPSAKGCRAYLEEYRGVLALEERRLAYVAVTRARDVLRCSGYWWSATAKKPLVPASPFLAEITEACEQGAGVADPPADEPADDDANPLLAGERNADVAWPPAPVVPEGTRWAATAVRAALAGADLYDGLALHEQSESLTDEMAERIAGWQRDGDLLLRERASGRGRRAVEMPQTLSVSDLVDVAADPEQFAARLLRPMPAPPAPAARQGTSFHAWVEQRAGGRALLAPDDLPGASDESMALPGDDLRSLQDAFLSTTWARREPVAVEVGFELVLDGDAGPSLVRGRIDAVYRTDDGGYDVIDYKTGSRPAGPAAARAAAIQLACYRLAWADIAQAPVEQVGAAFLYVREGEDGLVRPPLLSRQELAELLARPGTNVAR